MAAENSGQYVPHETTTEVVGYPQPSLLAEVGLEAINYAPLGVSVPIVGYLIGRAIYRRFSRDSTEVVKDRAESNIITILQSDNTNLRKETDELRKRIDEVANERNTAVSQLGGFIAVIDSYKEKILVLQDSVTKMAAKLEEQNELLTKVLVENAQLSTKVVHLNESNDRLSREMASLQEQLSEMYNVSKTT